MTIEIIFALIGPAYLLAVAWPLSKIDLRERRLPNRLVLPAIPITLLGQIAAGLQSGQWWRLWLALMAAAVAFGVGAAVNRAAGMGMGDVKLITSMSLALGWFSPLSPLVALFIGFAAATAVVLVLFLLRKTKLGSSIALGPYLLVGFAASLAALPLG
jgi:leader peptidase (prepilin peptidase)/N-methyltransferase